MAALGPALIAQMGNVLSSSTPSCAVDFVTLLILCIVGWLALITMTIKVR